MNEIIKIEGLRKRFGDNEVLKGITTSVSKGEVVASSVRRVVARVPSCVPSTFWKNLPRVKSLSMIWISHQAMLISTECARGGYGIPAVQSLP